MLRLRRHAWRVIPLLFLLALYWPGLTNWFYQDDFGWLNLRHDVHSLGDLGAALFAPKAHGNMRPLGENAYFLVLSSVFGVEALPFRIWAFATQMASLALLGSIVARMTGSRAAGFWAQIVWTGSVGLAPAMCWTSIYNQVLSGFFFLLALYFFQRHIESGGKRFGAAHWAAFVLGLGALETNVMYPAIAAIYALLFARGYVRRVLPMFAVSAAAAAAHFYFAPPPGEGVYALHADARMAATLWGYWEWALGPSRAAMVVLTGAAAALVAWQARARRWVGVFGLAWFAAALCPYLPLREHRMDYYLAVPAIGVAILGGAAATGRWRAAGWAGIALYLATSVPAARAIARWNHERGTRVEDMVLGVREIHEAQPGKTILLEGVDGDLFWSGIVDVPFRALEIPHVYLAPGSEARIEAPAGLAVKYTLPQAPALRALEEGRAVVYQVDRGTLRNITGSYRAVAEASWKREAPRFINAGDEAFGEYLGAGWGAYGDGYRVLRGTATVRMGGPRGAGERLYIDVFERDGLRLGVRVDGKEAGVEAVRRGGESTEVAVALGGAATAEMEVTLTNEGAQPLRFGFLEVR